MFSLSREDSELDFCSGQVGGGVVGIPSIQETRCGDLTSFRCGSGDRGGSSEAASELLQARLR